MSYLFSNSSLISLYRNKLGVDVDEVFVRSCRRFLNRMEFESENENMLLGLMESFFKKNL